jgi:hypothetical protein
MRVKFVLLWGGVYTVHKKKWPLQTISQNNVSCVEKVKKNCKILWMHQTKYFGLSTFFNYLCVFSPSSAQIIGSFLYLHVSITNMQSTLTAEVHWKPTITDEMIYNKSNHLNKHKMPSFNSC